MPFSVVIEQRALNDIQKAIDYYDEQQAGLGSKFNTVINEHIISIANNRVYDKFPFFK